MTSPAPTGLALPGLALPTPGTSSKTPSNRNTSDDAPVFGATQKPIGSKKRRRKLLNASGNQDYERALDEADDVDEEEWKFGEGSGGNGRKRQRVMDEDYGGDEGMEVDDEGEERMGDDEHIEEGEDGAEEVEDEGDVHMAIAAGGGDAVKGAMDENEKIRQRDKKAKAERFALRSVMDAEQAKRFDAFSIAVIPKQAIKRLNVQIYDQRINDKLCPMLAGMAKVFVADVVELAKEIQAESDHPTGPLRPYHLRSAREILERRQVLSTSRHAAGGISTTRKSLFRR